MSAIVGAPGGLKGTPNATVLGDFGRTVRDEPYFYIFKHRLFMVKDGTPAEPLVKWLRTRYAKSRKGHRYRVATYKAQDNKRFVDYILLETLTDNDLVEMRLHGWNWTERKVKRGDREAKRKLTRVQRRELNARIAALEAAFYEALDRAG